MSDAASYEILASMKAECSGSYGVDAVQVMRNIAGVFTEPRNLDMYGRNLVRRNYGPETLE